MLVAELLQVFIALVIHHLVKLFAQIPVLTGNQTYFLATALEVSYVKWFNDSALFFKLQIHFSDARDRVRFL